MPIPSFEHATQASDVQTIPDMMYLDFIHLQKEFDDRVHQARTAGRAALAEYFEIMQGRMKEDFPKWVELQAIPNSPIDE